MDINLSYEGAVAALDNFETVEAIVELLQARGVELDEAVDVAGVLMVSLFHMLPREKRKAALIRWVERVGNIVLSQEIDEH